MTKHSLVAEILLFMSAIFLVSPGQAGPLEPFSLGIGAGIYHDSNVYRRSKEGRQPVVSDVVHTLLLKGSLDETISRQHFLIDADITWYRFNNHDALDYDGRQLAFTWDWEAGDRLKGRLQYRYARYATGLDLYYLSDDENRNLQRTNNFWFDFEWKIQEGWRAVGSYSFGDSKNSLPLLYTSDVDFHAVALGGKYQYRGGSWWRLQAKETRQEYPHRDVNRANRHDIEWAFYLEATRKSLFSGHISYTNRKYKGNSDRNFSGITGLLRYNWSPTQKLNFIFMMSYDLSEQQEVYSDFAEVPRFRIDATWTPTTKIMLQTGWQWERYIFSGRDNPYNIAGSERKDTRQQIFTSVRYNPYKTLLFDAFYQRLVRGSTMAPNYVTDYDANIVGLNVNYVF